MNLHKHQIIAFLEDEFLQKTSDNFLDIGSGRDQGAGYIDSLMIDYFSVPTRIRDRRSKRLDLLGEVVDRSKDMVLWFDSVDLPVPSILADISENNYLRLFSILELVSLSSNSSPIYLDQFMQKDPTYSDIYVPESLFVSTETVTVPVTMTNTAFDIDIPTWFEFKVSIEQAEDTYDITFKVYSGKQAFTHNYENTIITKIIPPCEPIKLFRTTLYDSEMDAIISSISFSGGMVHDAILHHDQQGLYVFYTKYVMDAQRYYRIPFQIMHKGPIPPSTLECRAAVKDYLIDCNIASLKDIEIKFPELFIDCVFYVVPLWDFVTERMDRIVYPGYAPYLGDIYDKTYEFFKDDRTTFLSKAQLLLNAENSMFSLVYPHPLNAVDISLKELFPTYTPSSTHTTSFEYMDALDKEFAHSLIRSFALLQGNTTSSDVQITVEEDRRYVTFSAGRAEFHVMDEPSYLGEE